MTRQPAEPRGDGRRALPRPSTPTGIEPAAFAAVHEATRALLAAGTPREAVDVVLALVTTLGAEVVPARLAGADALPLDLSFGTGEPLLAEAEPASIPRLHLEVLLPMFLQDARRVVMDLRDTAQLRDQASRDPLTGLLNRRSVDLRLHCLRPGDSLAMIELDHLSLAEDATGQPVGDEVLAAFGRLLQHHIGLDDLAARYRGDEMLIALVGGGTTLLLRRIDQVRLGWAVLRPYPVDFSAGVASVTGTAENALQRAGQALSSAQRAGRNRTAVQP